MKLMSAVALVAALLATVAAAPFSAELLVDDECSEASCGVELMQRRGTKLVNELEEAANATTEAEESEQWQKGRETGTTCLVYHCGTSLGPTECHHFRCICAQGYLWSDLTKKCEGAGSNPIKRDTGSTCWFWGCSRWRGPTECIKHKCWCKEGYTAFRGVCEKSSEPEPVVTTAAPGASLLPATGPPPKMQTVCAYPDEQCGGADWTGATCCESGGESEGYTCVKQSASKSVCQKVSEMTKIPQYRFADDLRKPSSGKLWTFYMYRSQSAVSYPPENVNLADLGGAMWYLHNEIVGRADWGYKRKFNISRMLRYKVQLKATQPLIDRGMNFGVRFAFDSGQCTGPFDCEEAWQNYGYFIGCNKMGPFKGFPFPDFPVAYKGTWYSFPGKCPQMKYFEKTSKKEEAHGRECLMNQPGGFCETPTGAADCTYNFENAGEIDLSELVGITGDYDKWVDAGNREYDRITDHGTGMTFWDKLNDQTLAAKRVAAAKALFEKHYPGSYDDIDEPACDFDFTSFYKKAPGGYKDNGPAVPRKKKEDQCHTAVPGDKCLDEVKWAKSDGWYAHPDWYPGLTAQSPDIDFQTALHASGGTACKRPCKPGETES